MRSKVLAFPAKGKGSAFLRLSVISIFSLLLFAVVSSGRVTQGQAEVKPGQVPKDKIAQRTFSATDGSKFTLGSMQGKVVVVHFFGTWCGYSKRQIPTINKLKDGNNNSELQVIGMSVKDPRSNSQAVKQFITDQQVHYPVVSEVEDKYFVDFVHSTDVSVPQTLVYGRDGRLLAHYKGFNAQVGNEIEQIVKTGLSNK